MAGSNFSNQRPKKAHLVRKEKGGLAGEIGDLRHDVLEGFDSLEDCLASLISILYNNTPILSGEIKFNFQGTGVSVAIDGADPKKANITITPASGAPTTVYIPSIDTSNVAQGRSVYISANNAVLHSDARYYQQSVVLGMYNGISGMVVTDGVVSGKFSDASPMPVAGNRVFIARGDDEALDTAVGKLTVTPPTSGYVAEVGVVTYINAVTYLTTKTASMLVRVQQLMKRNP